LQHLPLNLPGYAVLSEAGIQSIDSLITKRCLNWWIKLINAPANSYIKLCFDKLLKNSSTSNNWATKLKDKLFPVEIENIWDNQVIRSV
jgi:hypothetical protein